MSNQVAGATPEVEKGNLKGLVIDPDLIIRGIVSQLRIDAPVNKIMSSNVPTIGTLPVECRRAQDCRHCSTR